MRTRITNGANKKLVLHVRLRCGLLSITTPVSFLTMFERKCFDPLGTPAPHSPSLGHDPGERTKTCSFFYTFLRERHKAAILVLQSSRSGKRELVALLCLSS